MKFTDPLMSFMSMSHELLVEKSERRSRTLLHFSYLYCQAVMQAVRKSTLVPIGRSASVWSPTASSFLPVTSHCPLSLCDCYYLFSNLRRPFRRTIPNPHT